MLKTLFTIIDKCLLLCEHASKKFFIIKSSCIFFFFFFFFISYFILQEWDIDPLFTFRLVVENANSANALITKHPKDILSKPSLISPVPLMMGMTSEEGAIKVAGKFFFLLLFKIIIVL